MLAARANGLRLVALRVQQTSMWRQMEAFDVHLDFLYATSETSCFAACIFRSLSIRTCNWTGLTLRGRTVTLMGRWLRKVIFFGRHILKVTGRW
jgi:hypothetical protein